jgi:dihydrofolate reductase
MKGDGVVRKLKLQMQTTVDGFVAGLESQLDWMTFEIDPQLIAFINQLTDTSDTILLGRKMTPGFITYWEGAATKPDSPGYDFAQKMVGLEKVVFSRTVHHVDGQNVRVHNGDIVEGVDAIKRRAGKDIIVYGGATFVRSLIDHNLIDEFNFFVNPVAIAKGMQVFSWRKPLKLGASTAYPCGIVVSTYRPAK